MTTVTFPKLKAALTLAGFDTENLLVLSKGIGIPQPTLWRWDKHGIPQNRRSQEAAQRVIEQYQLVLPEE